MHGRRGSYLVLDAPLPSSLRQRMAYDPVTPPTTKVYNIQCVWPIEDSTAAVLDGHAYEYYGEEGTFGYIEKFTDHVWYYLADGTSDALASALCAALLDDGYTDAVAVGDTVTVTLGLAGNIGNANFMITEA